MTTNDIFTHLTPSIQRTTLLLTGQKKTKKSIMTQNRSVWQPPQDAVLHEAPNLSAAKGSSDSSEPIFRQYDSSYEQSAILAPQITDQALPSAAISTAAELQAKIDSAIQQQRQRETVARRFRKPEVSTGEDEAELEYLKQKNIFEQQAGNKGDEASKWLVR